MNKLYSLLILAAPGGGSWTFYSKARMAVHLPDRGMALARSMLAAAGDDCESAKLLACVICRESLLTDFGPDIAALDPDNTYADVGRPSGETAEGDGACLYRLTEPSASMRRLSRWLDQDIKDRLSAPTWFEWMAAASLQLLRWAA